MALSEKELKIASLVTKGHTNKEISQLVGASEHMIKNRLRAVYNKLGFWNRVELALWYVHNYEFRRFSPDPVTGVF